MQLLKPQCPHCARPVALLSAPWQAQKGAPVRTCPFCNGSVEVKFKASIYVSGFAALAVCGVLAGLLWGAHGFSALFVAALLVPLVPSIYLAHAA